MRVLNGKTIRLVLALAALAALCGCAKHVSMGDIPPPPPPPPAPAPSTYEPVTQPPAALAHFRLTRSFAGPDTVLEPIPSAMLLLRKDARNNPKACEAFLKVPRTRDVLAQSTVDPNLIVTRMPLITQTPDTERLEDCTYLLEIYDYERARQWMTRLGLAGSAGPFLVVLFPPDGEGPTSFIALDAASLNETELAGLLGKWHGAMALASTELQKAHITAAKPTGTAASPACTAVGETVRVVSPVLIAMGAAALIAEYPAVGLLIGTITAKDPSGSVVAFFKSTISSLSAYLGNVAQQGCSSLINAIRTRIFGSKASTSAQPDQRSNSRASGGHAT